MRYQNITHDDMLNGDGIRVVLWLSGCEHHCKGCQNPITWNSDDGIEFDLAAMNELIDELNKDYVAGITFSGGDPLHPQNRNEVARIIEAIKHFSPGKTVWIYTGYTWEDIMSNSELSNTVRYADVLVDGRFIEALADRNYKWAGSTNQRVIDIRDSIAKGSVVIYESN